MKKTSKFILSIVLLLMVFSFALPAAAQIYNVGGKEVNFDGYFRQEFLFGTQSDTNTNTNQSGLNGAYQMWVADTNVKWNDNLSFQADLRMWGDLAYYMLDDNNHWNTYYGGSRNHLEWDTKWDQIIRELYFTYSTPQFLFRAGRQQIGWGEADGLRVMDIINPLDARRMFQFYDTEGYQEVRIPKLIVKTEFYPGNLWKFYDNAVELYWNPGDIHSFGDLLPSTLDAENRPWAQWSTQGFSPAPWMNAPWPTSMGNSWGAWAPPMPSAPVPVRLLDDKARAFTLSNSEYGVRFKLNIASTFITLNYWQGFDTSDHEIIKSHMGGLGNFGPFGGGVLHMDPLGLNPVTEGMGLPPVAAWFDKVQPRIKVAGFTLTASFLALGRSATKLPTPCSGWKVSIAGNRPLILIKVQYYVRSFSGLPSSLFNTVRRDQIRYMVGFDWDMAIPWNPGKATFVSSQFFHIYTRGNPGNLLQLAPYAWYWPQNQFYATLLLKTDYMNERISPSVLYVQDFYTQSAWIKSKIDFKWGSHWRPEIGYLWICANKNNDRYLGSLPTIYSK